MNASPVVGRRETNKSQKLERITNAARELFGKIGFAEVTTQSIAQAAGVATGTVFLYAKTKNELLLLAQNSKYADALEIGETNANLAKPGLPAILVLWRPIFSCNREHVENGRAYLREVMFGDSLEVNRQTALGLMVATQAKTSRLLSIGSDLDLAAADGLAAQVSALAFLAMSNPQNVSDSPAEVFSKFEKSVSFVLEKFL